MIDNWTRVDRYVDSFLECSPEILIAQGVHLLAAHRMRAEGKSIPPILAEAERVNALRYLSGRSLLQRMRSLVDGPMVLIKGPEIAAYYPSPTLRAYGDLDILVPDSASAKAVLLENGFEEVEDYEFAHTQRPLRYPGLPLVVELHHELPWLHWMSPPTPEQSISAAIPSSAGLDGYMTLPVVDHLMLIAAHSWKHVPFRRLIDFIDIAMLAQNQDRDQLTHRAQELGLANLWATMYGTSEHLLSGASGKSLSMKFMARHLHPPRDRTVAETHIARWLGAFWAPTSGSKKVRSVIEVIKEDMEPLPGEPRSDKLRRLIWALRDAARPSLLRQRDSGMSPK